MTKDVTIRPSPGDNTPWARLLYGERASKGLQSLRSGSAHSIITELPVPGLGEGQPVEWPSIKYHAHPSLKNYPIITGPQNCALGNEATVEDYVAHCVQVFREAAPVLRKDGTLWIYVRDRYVENKQLGLIPHSVAMALQADGWILRNEIVWFRDNTTPESVKDRLTRTHGTLFMFAHPESGGDYFYDADAIREPHISKDEKHLKGYNKDTNMAEGWSRRPEIDKAWHPKGRNKRTVWQVNLGAYLGRSVSPWPLELVEPMVRASVSEGGVCKNCGTPLYRNPDDTWRRGCGSDCEHSGIARPTVLDPFSGTAVTGKAALDWGANFIGIDLDLESLSEARARLEGITHSRRALQQKSSPVLDLFGAVDG